MPFPWEKGGRIDPDALLGTGMDKAWPLRVVCRIAAIHFLVVTVLRVVLPPWSGSTSPNHKRTDSVSYMNRLLFKRFPRILPSARARWSVSGLQRRRYR